MNDSNRWRQKEKKGRRALGDRVDQRELSRNDELVVPKILNLLG